MSYRFAIHGCQHSHIATFIDQMLALGGTCAGIYEKESPGLARKISEQHGIPLVDDPAVFEEESIRIIGSSAVNNRKIDVIEWCERHGKHVMVDKPVITGRAQLERLEAVIDRGRIQVGVMLTERFRPSVSTLKRAIDDGRLGRIVSVTMRKPHKLLPASRHPSHFSKEESGGIVIDLFIHDFDLLRFLTGQEVASIHTQLAKHIMPEHPSFYDTATAQVMMSGGTLAQLYTDWHTPRKSWTWGDCRIFVNGTEGCAELRLNGDPSVAVEELYFQITDNEPFEKQELRAPEANITEDFMRRIESKPSVQTHRDILETCRATVIADENAVVFDAFRTT
ncbi:Gfo/Idh/MocA family oxidoreductase [Paenibacillus hemerocallicola]|uniref:Gfo/Idh/MocA family oxidoreductase n=1 Tax=Paenibacillus hemerocallicola TaxID=1172614 RepID=A0A5C4T190_9BACL|nr:Gfo/Idh/MocA family oxidoreductase [Paenibacillus hemerocallicola]TNJ62007.1 Gfo/Idh/MocA family oxidoreductase [Paenibacillus hemerocallicola]